MGYKPTKWINTVKDAEGTVVQRGTPYNAENMNKIEVELTALSELPAVVTNQSEKSTQHEQRIGQAESDVRDISSSVGQPSGIATLNEEGIVPSSQLPTNLKEIRIVETITERDALLTFEGLRVLVTDASADPSVENGWAEYVWNGTRFIKVGEAANIDLVLSWNNINDKPTAFLPTAHTHKESDISDLDKYTKEQVNTIASGKSDNDHKHVEADITDLNKYTKQETDTLLEGKSAANHTHEEFQQIINLGGRVQVLETASGQLHVHENKDALDKITYSGARSVVDLIELDELKTHTHSYASLTGKPIIPSQTSQLTNNSGFVNSNAKKITVSATAPASPQPNDIWIVI